MEQIEIKYDKVSEYEDLEKTAKGLIEGPCRTIFSIFKEADSPSTKEDGWLVSHPDILSDEPVIDGVVNLVYDGWEGTTIEKVSNPTWKKIIRFFNNAPHGGYVFLEGLRREENDVYIVAGS